MGLGKGVRSPRAASAPCPAPTATRGSRPRSESSWPFLPLADSPFSSQSGPFQGGQSPHTPILHRGNQQNRRGRRNQAKRSRTYVYTHIYIYVSLVPQITGALRLAPRGVRTRRGMLSALVPARPCVSAAGAAPSSR